MFTGGTLLCVIFAIGMVVALYWPEIRAGLIARANSYVTLDCRGGVHAACDTCNCACHAHQALAEWVEHEARMGARAEGLGYQR
jgi:hypothetical protein